MRRGASSCAVVFIDGRAGSGKTTLAARLAAALDAETLHLDDLYPGWDGLAAGSRAVAHALESGRYRRYDWERGVYGEDRRLDRARRLVVEGCGAVTAKNISAAQDFAAAVREWPATPRQGTDIRVTHRQTQATESRAALTSYEPPHVWSMWVECPGELRRIRALDRDGEMFAPHWETWAAQEDRHLASERPLSLVDEVVHCC